MDEIVKKNLLGEQEKKSYSFLDMRNNWFCCQVRRCFEIIKIPSIYDVRHFEMIPRPIYLFSILSMRMLSIIVAAVTSWFFLGRVKSGDYITQYRS